MTTLIGHGAVVRAGTHDRRLGAVIVASVVCHAVLVIGSSPKLSGGSTSHAMPIAARLVPGPSELPPSPAETPGAPTVAAPSVAKVPIDPAQGRSAPAPSGIDARSAPGAPRTEARTSPPKRELPVAPVTRSNPRHEAASSLAADTGQASATGAATAAANALLDAYKSAGLDPPPRPLGDIEPEYPAAAGLQEGVVALRLLINEAGTVDRVLVLRSTPAGFFEESATRAFAAARFAPGRFLGIAVKSQITVEVEFTPINRGAVGGRTY